MIQINGMIKLGRPLDAATRKALVEMVRASRAEDGLEGCRPRCLQKVGYTASELEE